jgi:HAD superfamily hydrolase (TIGR01662 family)
MHAREPWEPFEARADRALTDTLRAHGIRLPRGFARAFRSRLTAYYVEREQSLVETTYYSVLAEMLDERGNSRVSEDVLRPALEALYAVTRENWVLEKDALLVLKMLESAGYRLGLVSNAGDDRDVRALAERFGIAPYFDFILTSAACSYRKPHPRIFELALSHWQFPAQEAAMVGDTLEADILGANHAGLYSIWITRRVPSPPPSPAIRPGATVETLIEVPDLLASAAG